MDNFKKTKKNFYFSLLSQIITISLGIIIPQITITGYGSEVNGLLTSVTQLITYLLLFESGINAVAKQSLYKPVFEKKYNDINSILSAVDKRYKKIGLIYLLSLIFIAILYSLFTKSSLLKIDIFLIVLFSGLGNVIIFFFQGKYKILLEIEGKNYFLINLQTIVSVLNHIIKIILLINGFNMVLIIAVSFFISIIQTFYILRYCKKNYDWINFNQPPNYESLKQSNDALIHQISGLIFGNTDVLLLTVFCDLKIVSVYSMYKLIISYITSVLLLPLNSSSFFFGQLYNTDIKKYTIYHDVLDVIFSYLTFSLFTITYFLILPFITIYTKNVTDVNYIDKYIALLFVIMEILNMIRMPLLNTINYAGHFKNTLKQTIIETSINIVVSFIGVIYLGIYGVIIGTIFALIYRTFDIIIYSNTKLLNRLPHKTIFIYFINAILFVFVSFILSTTSIKINSYYDFFTAGLIVTPLVLLLFIIPNLLIFKKEWTILIIYLKSKIFKRKVV